MYELRWVQNGGSVQLQYRAREVVIDNWGDIRMVKDWGEWQVVPIFMAEGAVDNRETAVPPEETGVPLEQAIQQANGRDGAI